MIPIQSSVSKFEDSQIKHIHFKKYKNTFKYTYLHRHVNLNKHTLTPLCWSQAQNLVPENTGKEEWYKKLNYLKKDFNNLLLFTTKKSTI